MSLKSAVAALDLVLAGKTPLAMEAKEIVSVSTKMARKGTMGSYGLLKLIEYGIIKKTELFAAPKFVYMGGEGSAMAIKSKALWDNEVMALPADETLNKRDFSPNYPYLVTAWKKAVAKDPMLKTLEIEARGKKTIEQQVQEKVDQAMKLVALASARGQAAAESYGMTPKDVKSLAVLESIMTAGILAEQADRKAADILRGALKAGHSMVENMDGTVVITSGRHKVAAGLLEADGDLTTLGVSTVGYYIGFNGKTAETKRRPPTEKDHENVPAEYQIEPNDAMTTSNESTSLRERRQGGGGDLLSEIKLAFESHRYGVFSAMKVLDIYDKKHAQVEIRYKTPKGDETAELALADMLEAAFQKLCKSFNLPKDTFTVEEYEYEGPWTTVSVQIMADNLTESAGKLSVFETAGPVGKATFKAVETAHAAVEKAITQLGAIRGADTSRQTLADVKRELEKVAARLAELLDTDILDMGESSAIAEGPSPKGSWVGLENLGKSMAGGELKYVGVLKGRDAESALASGSIVKRTPDGYFLVLFDHSHKDQDGYDIYSKIAVADTKAA